MDKHAFEHLMELLRCNKTYWPDEPVTWSELHRILEEVQDRSAQREIDEAYHYS